MHRKHMLLCGHTETLVFSNCENQKNLSKNHVKVKLKNKSKNEKNSFFYSIF